MRSRRYLPQWQPKFSELFSDVDLELDLATLLLLLDLQEQCTVDAGQNTTEGDSCADKGVQFFITTDGELEVARRDTLDLKILGGVTGQFENFSSEVLKDSSHVDSSYRKKSVSDGFGESVEAAQHTLSTDTHLVLSVVLQETLDTTTGELESEFVLAVAS